MNFKELSKKVTEKELIDIMYARRREDELDSLECGGVDNWSYYSDALSENFDEEYWDEEYNKIKDYYKETEESKNGR